MDLSALLGIPYPESDDPQTIALYMKDLAFRLDALLTTINNATVDFNNRPCAYWGAIGEAVPANSTSAIDWNLASPIAYNGNQSQGGASNAFPRFPEPRHGLWLLGASVPSLVMSGAINAGTERFLNIRARGTSGLFQAASFMGPRIFPSGSTVPEVGADWIEDLSYESNVGGAGTPLTIQGLAWIPSDTVVDPASGSIGTIEVDVGSGNTSSGFTLAANGAFLWAVWLGYGTDQIESL